MDPITHTTLGALAAYAVIGRRLGRSPRMGEEPTGSPRGAGALLFGAAGGALPDVDVFWGSLADPALPWEHHRHFTHALAFIPVGGLLAAAPLLLLFRRYRPQAGLAYLAATIGCATHGVNDTLTSYGTFLYWPFVNARVSWDLISIIDPLFTLTLILGILFGLLFASARPARLAMSLAILYLGIAFVQQQRVLGVQRELALERGHTIERGRAMPTMGNIVIWRSLYQAEGQLHADAVYASPFGRVRVQRGDSVEVLTLAEITRLVPDERSPQHERVEHVFVGFRDFADGYVAWASLAADGGGAVGDMRYSLRTEGFAPLWGIAIEPRRGLEPVRWVNLRSPDGETRGEAIRRLWRDLWSPGEAFTPAHRRKKKPDQERP